jgi:hypothetical protein
MQNSSTIDGLLSYVVKPCENNCPIGLWVAERVAERKLLNEDGIDMSEDTCSDVSLAKRDALSNKAAAYVSMEHLGGETVLEESGVFSMDGPLAGPYAVCLSNVMAVDADQLPDGFVALIGLPDVSCLDLSLDYIRAHPGCDWRAASEQPALSRCFDSLGWVDRWCLSLVLSHVLGEFSRAKLRRARQSRGRNSLKSFVLAPP